MMFLVWILTLLVFTHGYDKTKLRTISKPMKPFYLRAYLGSWYIQYRGAPCSWSGSVEFTDYQTNLIMESDTTVLVKETSRNDLCNTVNSRLYTTSTPGVLTAKDLLGNNWSGKYIVVYTDYKTCSITYGCTKMAAIGDKCDDGWISIKTRMINPGPSVISKINQVLQEHWGTTVDELQKVTHENSCFAPPNPYKGHIYAGYGGHDQYYHNFVKSAPSGTNKGPVVIVAAPSASPSTPAPAYPHPYGGYPGHNNDYFGKKYGNY